MFSTPQMMNFLGYVLVAAMAMPFASFVITVIRNVM